MKESFCLAICTYQRPHLLEKLINDIASQNLVPDILIIVDGDPKSCKVIKLAKAWSEKTNRFVIYQPANHANLSYQRYLAWIQASAQACDYLLYLDDDLRLRRATILKEMFEVMKSDPQVAGLTMPSRTGEPEKFKNHELLMDLRRKSDSWLLRLISRLRPKRHYLPGSLTPVGHHVPVRIQAGQSVYTVDWLQGRVMFYSMKALDENCFSEDLFALTFRRCGLGEDTFLSRQASRNGKLLWLEKDGIEHPDDDLPNSYPIKPFRFGFAAAYSRRFLNDHYRKGDPVFFIDRIGLIRAYFGESVIHFSKFVTCPSRARLVYFLGYLAGALKGLLVPPRAFLLAPGIDWRKDAQEAVQAAKQIKGTDNNTPVSVPVNQDD